MILTLWLWWLLHNAADTRQTRSIATDIHAHMMGDKGTITNQDCTGATLENHE